MVEGKLTASCVNSWATTAAPVPTAAVSATCLAVSDLGFCSVCSTGVVTGAKNADPACKLATGGGVASTTGVERVAMRWGIVLDSSTGSVSVYRNRQLRPQVEESSE